MINDKWVKRVTGEDIEAAVKRGDMAEISALVDIWQLQELKDQQLKDAEFEVIEPKQLADKK